MMNFANVTDIAIPQGNVIKIQETNTGRVLWEKTLRAQWEPINISGFNMDNAFVNDFVDDGENLIIFYRRYNEESGYNDLGCFEYKSEQNITIHNLNFGLYSSSVVYSDIDTESKKWFAFHIAKDDDESNNASAIPYAVNLDKCVKLSSQNMNIRACLWSSKLNAFLVITELNSNLASVLIDTDGNLVTPISDLNVENFKSSNNLRNKLCYANELDKFFLISTSSGILFTVVSIDGITWQKGSVISDTYKNASVNTINWIPERNILVTALWLNNSDGYSHIFTSKDGINWEETAQIPSRVFFGAWSPTKKIYCLITLNTSYITRNFKTWTEIPFLSDMSVTSSGSLKWSPTVNAFVLCPHVGNALTSYVLNKLVI